MLVESEQEFANVLDALLPEVHFVLKTDWTWTHERHRTRACSIILAKVPKSNRINQQSSPSVVWARNTIIVRESAYLTGRKTIRNPKINWVAVSGFIETWRGNDGQVAIKIFIRTFRWQNNDPSPNWGAGKINLRINLWSPWVKARGHKAASNQRTHNLSRNKGNQTAKGARPTNQVQNLLFFRIGGTQTVNKTV